MNEEPAALSSQLERDLDRDATLSAESLGSRADVWPLSGAARSPLPW